MMPDPKESTSETENVPQQEDLHLTIKPITARRMKLLADFKIERDED